MIVKSCLNLKKSSFAATSLKRHEATLSNTAKLQNEKSFFDIDFI